PEWADRLEQPPEAADVRSHLRQREVQPEGGEVRWSRPYREEIAVIAAERIGEEQGPGVEHGACRGQVQRLGMLERGQARRRRAHPRLDLVLPAAARLQLLPRLVRRGNAGGGQRGEGAVVVRAH